MSDNPNFPYKPAQWQKGQSGNPNGRTVRPSAQVLKEILDDTPFEKLPPNIQRLLKKNFGGVALKKALSFAMIEIVLEKGKGAKGAYDSVLDRHEGKVTQPLDVEGLPQADGIGWDEALRRIAFMLTQGGIKADKEPASAIGATAQPQQGRTENDDPPA